MLVAAGVVVVDLAGARVEDDVLEDRPEHSRGAVDLWFALGRQPNRLGVATALEVEDPVGAPAVLVVADQPAVGGRGQRRLAGARQAEEERGVAVGAQVGRAVHGEDILGGKLEVQRGEDRLLDLAGVGGPPDQHHPLGEVGHDEGARSRAVAFGIGLEGWGVIDDEVGGEPVLVVRGQVARCEVTRGQVARGRLVGVGQPVVRRQPQEHVVGEEVVPRAFGDDAHPDPVAAIRARARVADVQRVTRVQVSDQVGLQPRVVLLRHRHVDRPPVDQVAGLVLLHDEAVVGGASGVGRGHRHQTASVGQASGLQAQGGLVQLRGRQVSANPTGRRQSLGPQIHRRRVGKRRVSSHSAYVHDRGVGVRPMHPPASECDFVGFARPPMRCRSGGRPPAPCCRAAEREPAGPFPAGSVR